MDLRKVILPAIRDVAMRHATTGAGVAGVLEGDSLEVQLSGVAALLVSLGFAVCGEIKKRRRAKKLAAAAEVSPAIASDS